MTQPTSGLSEIKRPFVGGPGAAWLVALVISLFFIWGGATSLNDILIPKLKGLFQLSYAEAMLIQFAFFTAYAVVSVPAGALVARLGYGKGIVTGLLVMAAGCILFAPAAATATYGLFLAALCVLAGGITILQVAANPLIANLGPPATSHSRLTFAQAFNSLGTTVMPYLGARLILGSVAKTHRAAGVICPTIPLICATARRGRQMGRSRNASYLERCRALVSLHITVEPDRPTRGKHSGADPAKITPRGSSVS